VTGFQFFSVRVLRANAGMRSAVSTQESLKKALREDVQVGQMESRLCDRGCEEASGHKRYR